MANCKCGGIIVADNAKSPKILKCKQCDAKVYKESFGGKFTVKQMKTLLEGESVYTTFVSKKGKEYAAWAYLDFDEKKVKLDFDKEPPASFQCGCMGDVYDKGKLYECGQCKSKVLKEMSGVKISKKEAEDIFNEKDMFKQGFMSKNEKTFDAYVVLKVGSWAEFKFEETELTDDILEDEEEKKEEKSNDDVSWLNGGAHDDEDDNDDEVDFNGLPPMIDSEDEEDQPF